MKTGCDDECEADLKTPEPRPSAIPDCDEPPAKLHFVDMYEIRGMWNLVHVFRKLGTRRQAIIFAEEQGLIPTKKMCHHHGVEMSVEYSSNKTVGTFICDRHPCQSKSSVSRADGTIFENIRLPMSQIFYLMYAFANKWSYDMTIKEDFSENDHCLSSSTISDWFSCFRESVVIYQIEKQTFHGRIGGPGTVVQINDSKFHKRKYNKGRHIEGHWVLGMIENGSEDLRLEICPENIRSSSNILVPLIQKHVAEGTTIHTQFSWAYDSLCKLGYKIHDNNSYIENPSESADVMSTQRITAQWSVVKQYFKKQRYIDEKNLSDLIVEYLWRRNIIKTKKDPFKELIRIISCVYKNIN